MTRALILGVAGQDGSYLAEHLVAAGHQVWGMTRRPRPPQPGVTQVVGDLLDQASLEDVLVTARPDEVYNLAAVTAPGAGWGAVQPPLLAEVTGVRSRPAPRGDAAGRAGRDARPRVLVGGL